MADVTKDQVVAAMQIVLAVGDAIRDLGSVPSGELYARLMGRMSLETYNKIISTLKGSGLVKESAFLLTWIGPNKEQKMKKITFGKQPFVSARAFANYDEERLYTTQWKADTTVDVRVFKRSVRAGGCSVQVNVVVVRRKVLPGAKEVM